MAPISFQKRSLIRTCGVKNKMIESALDITVSIFDMSLRVSGNADRFADRIGPYGFAVLLGKSWRVNPFCEQRGDKRPRPVTLVGTSFPYIEFMPKPGQAKAVQSISIPRGLVCAIQWTSVSSLILAAH